MIDCTILHLLDGARQAKGLTVIIDVFRAFSLECYLYDLGASLVRPVGSVEDAFSLHEKIPDSVLIGERHGNSPSQVEAAAERIRGRVVIHTTSAGTQGIINAGAADEILTGSLVNARAVAQYIREHAAGGSRPVSIVAMGTSAKVPAAEDELCAEYIEAYVNEKEIPPSFEQRRQDLKFLDGKRFFDPSLSEHFPEKDYYMCIQQDIFPFVLRIGRDDLGFFSEKIPVLYQDV